MEIIDVSMTIQANMPVYKNKEEKRPRITVHKDFSSGNIYEAHIAMDMHTGTHIDMPLHILPGGASTDELDITNLITTCVVLDMTDVKEKITALELKNKDIKPGMFVLLETSNSYVESFIPEFVYLEATGAEYLKSLAVTGVGIDALGIERAQPDYPTHKILLEQGIMIIEGLRLAEVKEGIYKLIALPLKIKGVEAVPARVIIIKE